MSTANLTVIKEGVVVKTCLVEGELVLGRSKDSEIRLDDQGISRHHAVFKWVGGNLQVEKKSEFGTLIVNGADCVSARLNHSDVISIGPYLIKVSMEAGKSISTAPTQTLGGTEDLSIKTLDLTPPEALSLDNPETSSPESLAPLIDNAPDPLESSVTDSSSENSPSEEISPDGNALEFASEGNLELDAPDSSQDFSPEPEPSELIADDGKTKFTPASTLNVRLIFEPGTANVTDYSITKDETSIGRGKDCDIVLNDKKSSRKNSVIRKAGLNFLIKDLNSSNGTYVNGAKIQDHELSGDDYIKIGEVRFQFKAESAEYAKNQNNFMEVDNAPAVEGFEMSVPEPGMDAESGLIPEEFQQQEMPIAQSFASSQPSLGNQNGGIPGVQGMSGGSGTMGITGLAGGSSQKRTLLERFKELPKRTQIITAIAAILFFMFLTDEDATGIKKKKGAGKKTAVVKKNSDGSKIATAPISFDSLSAEQKGFVEAQHALAFDYYKNKEYDKSIFEITKIFALIPDYKDAREIERYAKEGKRKLEALEEERKKKEDEAQLKDKINHLVEDTKVRMGKKDYENVNELFTQILSLDPDNTAVAGWRKEIEAYKEQLKLVEQQKEVVAALNKNAWVIYKEGLSFKKSGKYHTAINSFQRALELGATQKKIGILAKGEIRRCQALIKASREPVLAEAKVKEDAGEYFTAFKLYKKATQIDPPHPGGYAGMNRVKGILHDRAKVIYTEAIIAESYSDFENAKKMFKQCLDSSPVDDIYHERAARKLAHYFEKKEEPQP
ncbi:MAG: FHA domain-containing protein [Bdellovibrionia bacterium]